VQRICGRSLLGKRANLLASQCATVGRGGTATCPTSSNGRSDFGGEMGCGPNALELPLTPKTRSNTLTLNSLQSPSGDFELPDIRILRNSHLLGSMPDASQIRAQSFTPEERKRGARRGGRARAARSRARSTTDDRPRGGADALGQPSVIAIDFMLGKQASTTWLVTAIATW
jgi:hypothetical protein